jgi:hypothetical protein
VTDVAYGPRNVRHTADFFPATHVTINFVFLKTGAGAEKRRRPACRFFRTGRARGARATLGCRHQSLLPVFEDSHGEFWRLLFLQAHRKTEAHLTATGMPSQQNNKDAFRVRRAAFDQSLKSKVGLAAAKDSKQRR